MRDGVGSSSRGVHITPLLEIELHRRVALRTKERSWGSYPLSPAELDRRLLFFQQPDAVELALFDAPTRLVGPSVD